MIDKQEFWQIILNGQSVTQIAAYAALMIVGVIMHLTLDVRRAIKHQNTGKFKLGFLIKDNPFRWIGIILFIFVSLIFYENINGQPITPFLAFMMGYTIDSLIGHANSKLKKK